jgi:hypothetical protein
MSEVWEGGNLGKTHSQNPRAARRHTHKQPETPEMPQGPRDHTRHARKAFEEDDSQ